MTAIISAITLIAVLLAAVQIRHVNRQMHRDFEMQYLVRFWVLMDRRSKRLRLKGVISREDRIVLQDYLSLCEDQIALRGLGRVTDHTWDYWRRDIRRMCLGAPTAAEISRASLASYPQVRHLLADPDYDPLEQGRISRFWRGL